MQVNSYRNPGQFMRSFSELDADPRSRRLAPTAARSEASQPTEELTDGDPRRACVGKRPPIDFITMREVEAGGCGADKTAVEHTRRTPEIYSEDLPRFGGERLPLRDHHQKLRAYEHGYQHVKADVVYLHLIQTIARAELSGEPQAGDERDCEHQPVGAHG